MAMVNFNAMPSSHADDTAGDAHRPVSQPINAKAAEPVITRVGLPDASHRTR
jgi:hypothetical protein